jgi:hypothetical protein
MRSFTFAALAAVVIAGCGGDTKSYSAGSYSVSIGDKAYYAFANAQECPAGGLGELVLKFVDYNYICDPTQPPQKDENIEHTTFEIIVTIGPPPDYSGSYPGKKPYEVSNKANCIQGPTSPLIGQFVHFAPKGQIPDRTLQADSGVLNITVFDPDNKKPLEGNFDLHFGAEEIKDSFKLESCS